MRFGCATRRYTALLITGRPWPSEFVWGVQNCVRWENVRVLGGVYDCPSWQAVKLAEGCGAAPNAPFYQMWNDWAEHDEEYTQTFQPTFIFVIGPAKPQHADPNKQPPTPDWLCCAERLIAGCRPRENIPWFGKNPSDFNSPLPWWAL